MKAKSKKLNLGCGTDIRKDYLNVDFVKEKGVDLKYNLNKLPLPFKDNSFEEILLLNILEHVNEPWLFMNEIFRIGEKGCIVKIVMPHAGSGNAWADMQHKRPFTKQCFEHKNILNKFEVIKNEITFPKRNFWLKRFANKYYGFYEHNLCYIFMCGDLHVELKVKK